MSKKTELMKTLKAEGYLKPDHPMKLNIEFQDTIIIKAEIGGNTCDLWKVEKSDYEQLKVGLSHVYAIDAGCIQKAWKDSGSNLAELGALITEFPALYYIPWVKAIKDEIDHQKHIFGNEKFLKEFEKKGGGRPPEHPFLKMCTNFVIFEEVNKLFRQGYTTSDNKTVNNPGSAFQVLVDMELTFPNGEKYESESSIRTRYYWFAESHYEGVPYFYDQRSKKVVAGPMLTVGIDKFGKKIKMISFFTGR